MTIQQRCIEAYRKHKHLKNAASEVGIPWQTVYVHLRKAGEPVTGDKSRYGSDKDRLAVKAEGLFAELVPFAEDQNRHAYQSKIDFVVAGNGVDVKASRRKDHGGRGRWMWSVKKQEVLADFFVCFGFDDAGDDLLISLLIPGELARKYTSISCSCSGGKWMDYAIQPGDLAAFFKAIGCQP